MTRETDVEQESELTKRAREVLAGCWGPLSPTMTAALEWLAGAPDRIGVPAQDGGRAFHRRHDTTTMCALRARGIVEEKASWEGHWRCTDLGRECARLLALEVSRG